MLSNFQREGALKGSVFSRVMCLTHKVLWSIYSLLINSIDLALDMVWYIWYLWLLVVKWFKTKKGNCWRTWWWILSWRGFQLAKIKFDRDGEGGRKALGMVNCSINISHESKLELAWSKKSSSYFESNFPIFSLSGVLNTGTFKMRDVLHWVNC